MTQPKRIQRKRTKGWRMPEGAVSVTRPGKFGNPFKVVGDHRGCVVVDSRTGTAISQTFYGKDARKQASRFAIRMFRHYVNSGGIKHECLESLRGHDLACFCKEGEPCHADVLLELANRSDV